MASANNSKPKASAPVIVLDDGGPNNRKLLLWSLPAIFVSVFVHVFLLGVFFLFSPSPQVTAVEKVDEQSLQAEQVVEEKKDPFLTDDVDPAMQDVDTDIQYMAERKADVSVPGSVNPDEAVGIKDGDKSTPPTNLPAPGGFGSKGQGGAMELTSGIGNSMAVGEPGGYGPRGLPLAGTFYGRSGATREYALREGGGTGDSEAAVARGLKWLARTQSPDGHWAVDGAFKDKGTRNDVAGTAFGLLPFLAGGKAHKLLKKQKASENPYDKTVMRGLEFLKRRQDPRKGDFGGGMYAHGLATIAMCEAYGMTQDPNLRPYAQKAVNYIVFAQHPTNGGWRYSPGQEGDTSVTGWQVMALEERPDGRPRGPQPDHAEGDLLPELVHGPGQQGLRLHRHGLDADDERGGPVVPAVSASVGPAEAGDDRGRQELPAQPPADQDEPDADRRLLLLLLRDAGNAPLRRGGVAGMEQGDARGPDRDAGREPGQADLRQLELPGARPRQRRRPADGDVAQPADAGGLLPLPAALLPRRRHEDRGGTEPVGKLGTRSKRPVWVDPHRPFRFSVGWAQSSEPTVNKRW